MRIDALVLAVLCLASSLSGQRRHRFSWQDYCFNHPAAPFCQGHGYAVRNPKSAKNDAASRAAGANTLPSLAAAGNLDWRFADPAADALAGVNFAALSASPPARTLISRLAAGRGLSEAGIQKTLDGLSGVNQLGISVRDGRVVVIVTGRVSDLAIPPQAGWKMATVSKSAILVGDPEAVDQAVRRIATNSPEADWEQLAAGRQAENEFWIMGSASAAGPDAVSAGVTRFFITVSIRDSVSSAAAFEFKGTPDSAAVSRWTPGAVEVEGNTVHVSMSLDDLAGGPLGQRLAVLASAAGRLPMRNLAPPTGTMPVIYGLEGGPKEVK
jgi:hypothetical protein